jgi:glycosyltransferase involved in cell wall biosynthesis
MKIIVHSTIDAVSITESLGKAQYSYYFVLNGFMPALRRLGTVVTVRVPEDEVDAIFDDCQSRGEGCIFLCFAPPQLVPVSLRCPTVPVIAWEFSSIPCVAWGSDPRSDWRVVFRHCGRVITLSNHTADLVREVMGESFPVFAIPTASYERFATEVAPAAADLATREISLRGFVFDSATQPRFSAAPVWPPVVVPDIVPAVIVPPPVVAPPPAAPPQRAGARRRLTLTAYYLLCWYRDVLRDLLPGPLMRVVSGAGRLLYRGYRRAVPLPPPPPVIHAEPPPALPLVAVTVQDVVYLSVLAPQDGRKNWPDMVSGFVWAFRDNPRATLILKMPIIGGVEAYQHMVGDLGRFAPFRCRVIYLIGFLEESEYAALVQAATYYVNTSSGEGLCLPLIEALCAGKPAVAPDHTALADYVTPDLAFVLRCSLEHNVWPHDPRDLFTTMRYRLNWASLVAAYDASFLTATAADGRYRQMSGAAAQSMAAYCSVAAVAQKLAPLCGALQSSPRIPVTAEVEPVA